MTLWFADGPRATAWGDADNGCLGAADEAGVWLLVHQPSDAHAAMDSAEQPFLVPSSLIDLTGLLEVCAPGVETHLVETYATRNFPISRALGDAESRLLLTPSSTALAVTWSLESHRAFVCAIDGLWLIGMAPNGRAEQLRLVPAPDALRVRHTPRLV